MLQTKKIVIVGLGLTGLSVLRYFRRQSDAIYEIKIIDTRSTPPGLETLDAIIKEDNSIEIATGYWQMEWLLAADQVVVNPGLSLKTPELQQAIAKGIEVIGDIELFARALNQLPQQIPVVGITGSNGKSTVTDLLGEIAKEANIKVGVGGNIGLPALDLLECDCSLYILELSSYQLETTHSLRLSVALFLNLAEDHMDRYQTMDNYRVAKQRIFTHADYAVVNAIELATFPLDSIVRCSDFSINKNVITNKELSDKIDKNEYHYRLIDGYLSVNNLPILDSKEIALIGQHHLSNCLAVLATVDRLASYFPSLTREIAIKLFSSYHGLKHRCQIVADTSHLIRWINDSKATNVASTLAALNGLKIEGTLHLFMGGDSKKADLTPLIKIFEKLSLKLYCYGKDGIRFLPLHQSAQLTDTLEEAVLLAMKSVKSGDTLLLSPACASFDQYKNFEVRGDFFCELAKRNYDIF